ncbi:MAG: SelT/SelW/SelH family protein [Opitutales bacterium]
MSRPRIEIHFCPACRWWLRAGWMAQEIFATFGSDVGEVALVTAESGHFSIRLGEAFIWERKRDGGFPEPKVLKQRLQPYLNPEHDLGHSGASESGRS